MLSIAVDQDHCTGPAVSSVCQAGVEGTSLTAVARVAHDRRPSRLGYLGRVVIGSVVDDHHLVYVRFGPQYDAANAATFIERGNYRERACSSLLNGDG
jgi:hypothetical protein